VAVSSPIDVIWASVAAAVLFALSRSAGNGRHALQRLRQLGEPLR